MKNYLERFIGNPHSLQRKIIGVCLFLAVVPMVLITLVVTAVYYHRIRNSAYGLLEQNARQHEIIVQERIENYENVLYELVADASFIELARVINSGDSVDEVRMKRLMSSGINTYDQIRSAVFLADNGRYVSYSRWYGSKYDSIWPDAAKRTDIYDEINEKQSLTFIAPVNISIDSAKADNSILMGFPVKDLRTHEQSGILVLALDHDCLLFEAEDAKLTEGVRTVVTDGEGRILAGTENRFTGAELEAFLAEGCGERNSIELKTYEIGAEGWRIVHIIDKDIYQRDIYQTLKAVLFAAGTIIAAAGLLMWFIFRKYIGNIQKIAQGIQDYGGETSGELSVKIRQEDELYTIVRQFNEMTARVNRLVKTLERKNIEIRDAAVSQKHAEIKALEAQINPHFLFNTLDSINWRAIENDEEEISEMLGMLGSLLRYSVSNIESMVCLEAEVSWLKKYIFLQRERFGYSFDCCYDIAKEAMGFPVYKMLLQPLIENVILHAFEDVREGGVIGIRAFVRRDARLEIHITDNGCGMEKTVLQRVREETQKSGALNSESIGISNVVHRLRIYYQDEAEITVNSRQGIGSEFILVIPPKAHSIL